MTHEELDLLADKVSTRMTDAKRAQWIDPQTHAQDHSWVKGKRITENDLIQLRKKIIQSASIWVVIIILGFCANALWNYVIALIKARTVGG